MRRLRLSIADLCVVNLLIALDAVLLGWAILERESVLTIRGVLLMMNVLGFGLYRLLLLAYRNEGSPFLTGFVVAGSVATLVYFDCCQLFYRPVLRTQKWTLAPIGVDACHIDFIDVPSLGMTGRITPKSVMCSVALAPVVVTLVGLPQLLVALVGGVAVATGPSPLVARIPPPPRVNYKWRGRSLMRMSDRARLSARPRGPVT
jgi:hypothetical protein